MRKRGWLIRAVGVALGAVVLAAAPVPASAAPTGGPCALVEMRKATGGLNLVEATDRTGRYQVGVATVEGSPELGAQLVLWRDGTPQLGPRLASTGDRFVAVGPTGIAVGVRERDGRQRAAAYTYGQILDLPGPGADVETTAVAVNRAGQIAGGVPYAASAMKRVLVWSADGEVSARATPPGFEYAQASEIDEDGTVLGLATNDPIMFTDAHVVAWLPDGTPRLLPVRDPGDPTASSWPVTIRDGKVIASRYSGRGGWETVEWVARGDAAPRVLPVPDNMSVYAVNARGSIALSTEDGPALLQGGQLRPLRGVGVPDQDLLADNDVVYGNAHSGRLPVYADCRT
jgi:hypothetical protein